MLHASYVSKKRFSKGVLGLHFGNLGRHGLFGHLRTASNLLFVMNSIQHFRRVSEGLEPNPSLTRRACAALSRILMSLEGRHEPLIRRPPKRKRPG